MAQAPVKETKVKMYIAEKALICGGKLLSTKAPFALTEKQLDILKTSGKSKLVKEVK